MVVPCGEGGAVKGAALLLYGAEIGSTAGNAQDGGCNTPQLHHILKADANDNSPALSGWQPLQRLAA